MIPDKWSHWGVNGLSEENAVPVITHKKYIFSIFQVSNQECQIFSSCNGNGLEVTTNFSCRNFSNLIC